MRAFICGIDGYIGWSLANHLASLGWTVAGLDDLTRRFYVKRVGGQSVTPIESPTERVKAFEAFYPDHPGLSFSEVSLAPSMSGEASSVPGRYHDLVRALKLFAPDVIFNLAQQPSAPFSMIDQGPSILTGHANYIGNRSLLWAIREACPKAHLMKLGTMGEYGTPGIPIPEGVFPEGSTWANNNMGKKLDHPGDHIDRDGDVFVVGHLSGMMFPRKPGSFYHATKVAESIDCEFAARAWGLTITDVMQGIVYGTRWGQEKATDALCTRLDVDECFGTVVHRFAAQVLVGIPLTVYGKGGQTRGYLPLCDSVNCLAILAANPPDGERQWNGGAYRVVNQIEETHTVNEIADAVCCRSASENLVGIDHVENPRVEEEEHSYDVEAQTLRDLGYQPASDLLTVIDQIFEDIDPDRIPKDALQPKTQWT